jgi:4-hydroxy-4-methyl-2-oxoglutarate aldolase
MIVDPPVLTLRRKIERPRPDLVGQFTGVATSHIVDALGGCGALEGIKPIDPHNASFCGAVLPCETGPSDNLALLAALSFAEPGDVIVAAAANFTGSAVVGDNVALMARNRGVAAVVTDGMARDSRGIIEAGLPVFARGVTPNSCVRTGPGRVGFPIVAAGVHLQAGDIVVGDCDGVVVIPASQQVSVLTRLATVLAAEEALQARIREGLSELDPVRELLASTRVHYIE